MVDSFPFVKYKYNEQCCARSIIVVFASAAFVEFLIIARARCFCCYCVNSHGLWCGLLSPHANTHIEPQKDCKNTYVHSRNAIISPFRLKMAAEKGGRSPASHSKSVFSTRKKWVETWMGVTWMGAQSSDKAKNINFTRLTSRCLVRTMGWTRWCHIGAQKSWCIRA